MSFPGLLNVLSSRYAPEYGFLGPWTLENNVYAALTMQNMLLMLKVQSG